MATAGHLWKSGLERRGMKITWCKMGVNERDPGRTVKLQGLEKSGGFGVLRVNTPEKRRLWKRGEETFSSRLERVVESVSRNECNSLEDGGWSRGALWFRDGDSEETGG